jgi:urea carboxylase
MIYDEPKFLPAGDRYVLVEFGNEMQLDLNFLAQGLGSLLLQDRPKGLIETAPCFASLLIHYEPELISLADLTLEVRRRHATLGSPSEITIASRIFYLPAMYLDPWTRECVEHYSKTITPKEMDADLVVRHNGLKDTDQLIRVHSGTEYWVAALGFWPGLPFLMPLDPRCALTAPKYNPPRTRTPAGAIGLGGGAGSIYSVNTPGGYQIFARTPVPIWDPQQRFEVFSESICLFRPGDRIKFMPCSQDEFIEVERQVAEGTYVFNLVEYQMFSVAQYNQWIGKVDRSERF